MSESETAETTDQETKTEHNPRKRVRHRKKQLYDNILKQMEFYFSDANLTKDRFLGDLVKSDPNVPLDVFLKFNKIRAMTQDVNDIAKAIKHSTKLELSEDKTKVKRKTPVQEYNADLRTIYVESIPVTASRDWLQKVFAEYGDVAYISLPKFKNSQKNKGYGFIEFSKPEEAQKCLNMFTKMGCKLPTCMPPEQLSSIKTFSIEESHEENMDNIKAEKNHEEHEPPKKKKKNKEKKSKHLELKLGPDIGKRVDTSTPTTPSEETKNIAKTPTEEENKSIASTPTEVNKNQPTEQKNQIGEIRIKSEPEESKDELTSQDEGKPEGGKKKKTRKRTAKERNRAKNNNAISEASKGALWGLQVLSKPEWKALRNKYLNLQRQYMKEIKMTLQNKRSAYSRIPAPAATEAEQANPQARGGTKTVEPLERVPGVFVKAMLSEPVLDVRLTKRTVRSNIHVVHVEAKEGQPEIVIRFDSAKTAEEYSAQSNNRARVLSGVEEEEQWAKAEAARCNKRVRGRTKLLERHDALVNATTLAPASPQPTHTHIRFDDE